MESLKFSIPEERVVIEQVIKKTLVPLTNTQIFICSLPTILLIGANLLVGEFRFNLEFRGVTYFTIDYFDFALLWLVSTFGIYKYFQSKNNPKNNEPPQKLQVEKITPAEDIVFDRNGIFHRKHSIPPVEINIPWAKINEIVIGDMETDIRYSGKEVIDFRWFISKTNPFKDKQSIIAFLENQDELIGKNETVFLKGEYCVVHHFTPK